MSDEYVIYYGRDEGEGRAVETKEITKVARISVIAYGSCTRARAARPTS
jgi:hypothetical protein